MPSDEEDAEQPVCEPCEDGSEVRPPSRAKQPGVKRDANGNFNCPADGCGHKATRRRNLTQHLADRHHIGVEWVYCDRPGCEYKATRRGNLTRHLADRHDIGVKWVYCDQPGCEYKTKQRDNLTKHLADRHDIGVKWVYCDQPGCEYKAKQRGNLTRHLADRHDIGVEWVYCDQPGCEYKTKQRGSLTKHLADRHDIGVEWVYCDQPGCEYKTKRRGSLTQHLAFRHDIGVEWVYCDQPGCEYKTKQQGNLTRHLASQHYATFCQRKKMQEERVRTALLANGWREWSSSDTLPPPGYFKREHQIDFRCADASADRSFCRIDFVLSYEGPAYVFFEVDENQHRFGYLGADGAGISCDAKRMANVHTSLTFEFVGVGAEPPPIYWLRYNPHGWHVDGVMQTVSKAERESRLCAFLARFKPAMGIGYAFYDSCDAELDVLAADEFPDVLRDLVNNLEGVEDVPQ